MSRGHNARKKTRRQQARAVAQAPRRGGTTPSRRRVPIIPVLSIAGAFAATAVLGFGVTGGTRGTQVDQDVAELLVGVPQRGNTLGSPEAPMTLQIFADLECPTVKLFAERYLPSLINTWVRSGDLKLTYHSLKTDTADERDFFRQEVAALAAGRQDKMWNFVLTFLHEQESELTGYATDDFLTDIAGQAPNLNRERWREDRTDSLLMKQVALGVRFAHARNLRSTPSFLIRFTDSKSNEARSTQSASTRREFLASFKRNVDRLRSEAFEDTPTVGVFNSLN
jgi:protein-disulfide isomerase